MKPCLTVALASLLLILIVLPCAAAEYYVAQKDPAAADKNPGTLEKPFLTINAGLPKLKAGDTLNIREGTYRESLMLNGKEWGFVDKTYPAFPTGESYDRAIRIVAYGREKPVIKGSDVVTGWKKHKPNGSPSGNKIWVKDWANNTQQVFCDGKILQQIAGLVPKDISIWWRGRKGEGLSDIEAGSFYYDVEGKKLYVWLADGGDPNTHEMEVSVRPFLLWAKDQKYIYVRGLTCMHSNTSSTIAWPASVFQGSYNIMEDCEFVWCDFGGLSVMGSFVDLIRVKMNHNGDSGFGASGRGHRFVDCEFSFNNYRRWSASWHAGGMKFNGSNILFSGCTAEGNIESPGFWSDGECSNITIENSRAMRNGGAGIMIEIGQRAVLRNNLCYENQGYGIYISNSALCALLHNVCYRNNGPGIVVIGVNRVDGWYFDDEKTGFDPARGNVVRGNIFMDNCWNSKTRTCSTAPDLILPNPDISSNEGCVSDYNLFYRSDKSSVRFEHNYGERKFADLKAWQTQAGQDKHSIIAEPLFVDAAKYDFRPVKGSPAIRLTRPYMGVQIDMDGKERDCGEHYTAGAYEAPLELIPKHPKEPPVAVAPLPMALPADRVAELPAKGDLAKLAEALKEVKLKKLPDGKTIATIKGIPFNITKQMIVLDEKNRNATVAVGKGARRVYLLTAAIDPPKDGMMAMCKVFRQDGKAVYVQWITGENIGPSLGAAKAIKSTTRPSGDKTEVAWESKDKSVRLFLTTWENDNYWYPLRDMTWWLMDGTAMVVVGVTIQPDK